MVKGRLGGMKKDKLKLGSKEEGPEKNPAGEKSRDKVTIKIPRPLYNKLKVVISESGYDSVTDFIVFVLRDLIMSAAASGQSKETELENIKQRLKSLGYL
jgi:Arc/MetJ-type ribon-helix-helix transcriptional regulator